MVLSFQLFVVVAVVFGTLTEGVIVRFKDCGSKLGKLTSLDFDCNEGTSEPCTFTRGKDYHGKVSLTPNTVINNGTIDFHAIIGGVTVPFPFPDNDICKNHNVTCPLKADVGVGVDITLGVPSFAPAINLVAKMEIKTSNGKELMCGEFLAKLV